MTYIGPHPPPEMYAAGGEIDCACARCGSSCVSESCPECDQGVVWDMHGLCDEEGPAYTCPECRGDYVKHYCGSGEEWCEANPLPGRESVRRGRIEWFTVEERKA